MPSAVAISAYQLYVGVDISARTFTASSLKPNVPAKQAVTFQQTPDGFRSLEQWMLKSDVPAAILVVMEATSTYWITLAGVLHQAGFAISVLNPAQAHHEARALLKRVKTDVLDAQTLAQLAQALQPDCWTPPPQVHHVLKPRLTQRNALLDVRLHVSNQLHALSACPVIIPSVRERMQHLIGTLTEQIRAEEKEIEQVIVQDKDWAKAIILLQTIPGIGLLTACWLVVCTLNFTTCPTAEAAAHYAGLAPVERSSGSSVWKRPTIGHGGNGQLRTTLYMATLSAAQHNPIIKAFYEHLRAAGKPMKVTRCAAARKLLHLACAIVKSG